MVILKIFVYLYNSLSINKLNNKVMEEEKLKRILEAHEIWLKDTTKGKQANLEGANLKWVDLQGVNLERANLSMVRLERANLEGANLTRANLEGANLTEANLTGANLEGVNLTRANLEGASLGGASLEGANLEGANLYEAILIGTDLRRANLKGVDLDYASLSLSCFLKFKADSRICKQLVAHTLKIMELSNEGSPELLKAMREYKSGWHREEEFK